MVKKKTTIKRKKNKHDTTVGSQADPIDTELKNLVQNASDLLGPNITKLSIKKEKVSSSFVKKKPSFKNKSMDSGDPNITSCSNNANADSTSNLTKTVVKTEITLERNDSSSKIKKQPSKKLRLTQKDELENIDEEENLTKLDQVDQGETKTIKKKNSNKKKHRKSSSTSKKNLNQLSLFKMPEPLATSSLSTTLINNLKEINVIANTPNTKLQREIAAETTNSKTIKAKQQEEEESKPMTRRAAAAAAAISTENKIQSKNKVLDDIAKTINASGKVKQMVELHEARIKPNSILNTPPTIQKSHAIRQLQYTNSKFKTNSGTISSVTASTSQSSNNNNNSKIRSSIDKRKIRISNQKAKADNKRQSVKKVTAFLKDLSESQSSGVSIKSEKLSFPNTDDINESLLDTQSIKSEPNISQQVTNAPTTQQLTSTVKKLNNHFLASSSTVQQQYKVISNTPGFTKFLERNTPNKMSRSEMELKRKAELLSKEKKEQERLHEREKQLQEKVEIAKK